MKIVEFIRKKCPVLSHQNYVQEHRENEVINISKDTSVTDEENASSPRQST